MKMLTGLLTDHKICTERLCVWLALGLDGALLRQVRAEI